MSGCSLLPSVGPDYAAPELALPQQWLSVPAAASDSSRLADWWRQLDDPELNRLIDQATSGNLDLRQAQARLRQARAARAQAVGDYFPTLGASGGASRSKGSSATGSVSAPPPQTVAPPTRHAPAGGKRHAPHSASADKASSAGFHAGAP